MATKVIVISGGIEEIVSTLRKTADSLEAHADDDAAWISDSIYIPLDYPHQGSDLELRFTTDGVDPGDTDLIAEITSDDRERF